MARALLILPILALAGCAGAPVASNGADRVHISPDDPVNPRTVRFEVPSAWLFGMPGDEFPLTLRARMATREIASRELAAAGYCPNGFTGPDGIHFPGGDRSRSIFEVRCVR